MKTTAIVTAAILAATSTSAMDFSVAGQTLSIGAETDLNYTTGVEEWVWDCVEDDDEYRRYRGGSHRSGKRGCRVSNRMNKKNFASGRLSSIGFRFARTIQS